MDKEHLTLSQTQKAALEVMQSEEVQINLEVSIGIPQWSVLDPILLNILINQLLWVVDSKLNCFADDCISILNIFNKLGKKLKYVFPSWKTLSDKSAR